MGLYIKSAKRKRGVAPPTGALLIDVSVPPHAVLCCPHERVSTWKDSTGGLLCRSTLL